MDWWTRMNWLSDSYILIDLIQWICWLFWNYHWLTHWPTWVVSRDAGASKNKIAKLGDAITISNLKLWMTVSLTDWLTGKVLGDAIASKNLIYFSRSKMCLSQIWALLGQKSSLYLTWLKAVWDKSKPWPLPRLRPGTWRHITHVEPYRSR